MYRIQTIWLFLFVMFLISGMAYAGATKSSTSYIDEHNRFILNGEPFFPLGLFVVQSLTDTSQLDEIANGPFDTVMNYNINNGTDAQITNYLNQLQARNLKLIFSLKEYIGHRPDDISTITHKVNTFKRHPSIISWYMNDERGPEYLRELEARYQKVRELDDNHPVWSVHWNTDWLIQESHTTDIVGVDPYPIPHLPITNVSRKADEANAAGKPLWLVPQIFSWTDYAGDFRAATGRPPTRDEMRAMTYLAINHGAKGLIYYSYFNIVDYLDYTTRWPQIKEIASEVHFLRPVILSTQETRKNYIVCGNDNIDFKLMREGDTYYLFAVNTKKETITGVQFQNRQVGRPEMMHVLFENGRQVALSSGKFVDDFDPYEVHVYVWTQYGDISCDGKVDLADAILSFQGIAGLGLPVLCASADVGGDGKIGLSEVMYILQYVAGLR